MLDQRLITESAAYELSRLLDESGQLELAAALAEDRLNRDHVTEAVQSRPAKKKEGRPHRFCHSGNLNGYCVTVSAGETPTLAGLGEILAQLQKKLRRALEDGIDIKSFMRSLED